MGYHITYSPQTAHKFLTKKRRSIPAAWLITAVVALVLAAGGWKWLLPGDPEQTRSALTGLVEDVRAGDSLGHAVTAFCQEIIENAQ